MQGSHLEGMQLSLWVQTTTLQSLGSDHNTAKGSIHNTAATQCSNHSFYLETRPPVTWTDKT